MSHFFVGVILPTDVGPNGKHSLSESEARRIMEHLNEVLEPYNENVEVAPYEEDCYCLGNQTRKGADYLADKKFGTIAEMRDKFAADHPEWENLSPWDESDEAKKRQAAWKTVIQPRIDFEKAEMERLAKVVKPAKDCDECHGTGKRVSKYNPNSKWDWWVVGGRWDGVITGKARDDGDGGFNFGDEHHQLKFNLSKVADLRGDEARAPFAVVLPDGLWVERGKMGWWAMVSDEKEKSHWKEELERIFDKYADCYVVGCDMHI